MMMNRLHKTHAELSMVITERPDYHNIINTTAVLIIGMFIIRNYISNNGSSLVTT